MAQFIDDFEGPAGPLTGRVVGGAVWTGDGGSPPSPSFTLSGLGDLEASTAARANYITPADWPNIEDMETLAFSLRVRWPPMFTSTAMQFGLDTGGSCWVYVGRVEEDEANTLRVAAGAGSTAFIPADLSTSGALTLRAVFTAEPEGTRGRYFVGDALVHEDVPTWNMLYGSGPPTFRLQTGVSSGASFVVESASADDGGAVIERPPAFWTNFRRTYEIR